jgi:hypothetical protein
MGPSMPGHRGGRQAAGKFDESRMISRGRLSSGFIERSVVLMSERAGLHEPAREVELAPGTDPESTGFELLDRIVSRDQRSVLVVLAMDPKEKGSAAAAAMGPDLDERVAGSDLKFSLEAAHAPGTLS